MLAVSAVGGADGFGVGVGDDRLETGLDRVLAVVKDLGNQCNLNKGYYIETREERRKG